MAVALTRMMLPMLGGLAGTARTGERGTCMRNNRDNYGLEVIVALDSNNLYHNIIVVNFILCHCKAIIIIILLLLWFKFA